MTSTPSATDLAYAAGIIDGEGSISMQTGKWNSGKVVVTVDSSDRELIDWLKERFGGYVVTKKRYQDHHRQCWSWRRTGRAAIEILRLVLPYMVIERKRARAEMLLHHYESVTPRNGHYTPEMREAKRVFNETFLAIK